MASERISLDTNILWHGMLQSDDPVAPICREILGAVDDGDLEAYASTLSIVELPKVIRPKLPIEKLVALTEQLHVGASSLYTHDRDDFPVDQLVDGVRVQKPSVPSHLAQQHFEIE